MNIPQATILVVDDNPTNLDLLFEELDQAGFKVLVATDGDRAIHQAELARPDAILLDVLMPGLDGFETCQRLKANQATRDIPVVFMTALTDTVDEVKGLQLGAVDYITKPIRTDVVLARLNTHLTLQHLQQELQAQNGRLQQEIRERQRAEAERKQLIIELQKALAQVKKLSGLLPICANCKKIRNDDGYWQDVAVYIRDHSEAEFSHGICPDCAIILYPDYYKE